MKPTPLHPSPLPMVMVVANRSPKVGVAGVEALPSGFPHLWEPFGWLDFSGG